MPPLAALLSQAAHVELPVLANVYLLGSFICVAGHTYQLTRRRRLFPKENAPLSFAITPSTGWWFIGITLGLIYLQSILYCLVVVGGVFAILMEEKRSASEQFGLARMKPIRVLGWSLLILGTVILVEAPLIKVSEAMLDALKVPHPEQEAVETFRQFHHTSTILFFMAQAVLIQPMIEELFFRGFLLTFLKEYTSTWLALVLSSGVFAFAHLNLGVALPLWFLGVVLGMAYEQSGSLLLPVSIHGCFNLVSALSLLLEKGNG